ncbi:hypothetical protein EV183_005592, partial [Coemansia sp. RSA 2336]
EFPDEPRTSHPTTIPLVNPHRPQNGFSKAIPPHLPPEHAPIWLKFIEELNETLAKLPGTVTKELAGFWLFNVATLGMAWRSCGLYENRVVDQAMCLVEKYNCSVFADMNVSVSLKITDLGCKEDSAEHLRSFELTVNCA